MTTATPAAAAPRTTVGRKAVYTTVPSPLGELLLTGEETAEGLVLTSLTIPGQRGPVARIQPGRRLAPAAFQKAVEELGAYFAGELKRFSLPLASAGTAFQRRVWEALDRVPHGTTTTYRALAAAVGAPGAVRAVGRAVGANPLLIVRPCHRVIGSDGSLTGYAGGVEAKRRLLTLEGALPR